MHQFKKINFFIFFLCSSILYSKDLNYLYEKGNPAFAFLAIEESYYATTIGYDYLRVTTTENDSSYIRSHRIKFSTVDDPYQGVFAKTPHFLFGFNYYLSLHHVKNKEVQVSGSTRDTDALSGARLKLSKKIGMFLIGGDFIMLTGEIPASNKNNTINLRSYLLKLGIGFLISDELSIGLYYKNYYFLDDIQLFAETDRDRFFGDLPVFFILDSNYETAFAIWRKYNFGTGFHSDISYEETSNSGPSYSKKYYDFDYNMHFFSLSSLITIFLGDIYFEANYVSLRMKCKNDEGSGIRDIKDYIDFLSLNAEFYLFPIIISSGHKLKFSIGYSNLPFSRLLYSRGSGDDYKTTLNRNRVFLKVENIFGKINIWLKVDYMKEKIFYYDVGDSNNSQTENFYWDGIRLEVAISIPVKSWYLEQSFIYATLDYSERSGSQYSVNFKLDEISSKTKIRLDLEDFSIGLSYILRYAMEYFDTAKFWLHSFSIYYKMKL